MPELSIVIVNHNTCGLLLDCLRSLHENPPSIPFEVIVVDNASSDNSVKAIRRDFPHVRLVVNAVNAGFAVANNRGIEEARGDYVLLLNSDTRVDSGALDRLALFLDNSSRPAAAAPLLLNEDGSFQRSFFQFPNAAKVFLHILGIGRRAVALLQSVRQKGLFSILPTDSIYSPDRSESGTCQVPYVLFACIMFKREVFERVGLLDEAIFFYHEDCEFGYRLAKSGIPIWWVPSSRVYHLGGGSSRLVSRDAFESYFRSLLYVFRKHESLPHYWALRAVILIGFLFRAFIALFGGYRSLEIPSTYKSRDGAVARAFAAPLERARYYLAAAGLALRRLAVEP